MTCACNRFYKVASGDTCQAVATRNNIALTDFYAWNPAVGTRGSVLQVGVWVCVGFDARLLAKSGEGAHEMPEPTAPPVCPDL